MLRHIWTSATFRTVCAYPHTMQGNLHVQFFGGSAAGRQWSYPIITATADLVRRRCFDSGAPHRDLVRPLHGERPLAASLPLPHRPLLHVSTLIFLSILNYINKFLRDPQPVVSDEPLALSFDVNRC